MYTDLHITSIILPIFFVKNVDYNVYVRVYIRVNNNSMFFDPKKL